MGVVDVVDTHTELFTPCSSESNHPILLNPFDIPFAWRVHVDITAVWPMCPQSMIETYSPYESVGICDVLVYLLMDACYDNISVCIIPCYTSSILVQSKEKTYSVGVICIDWMRSFFE